MKRTKQAPAAWPASTIGFLDAIARRTPAQDGSPASDYRLHQILGVTRSAISRYRNGLSHPDDAVAMRIAAMLDLPEEYVVACIHEERAQAEAEKSLWRSIASKFAGMAAAALLFLAVFLPPPSAHASTEKMRASFDNNTDYAYFVRFLATLAAILGALAHFLPKSLHVL